MQFESLKAESHEVEECRERSEAPMHRLKELIEEQRYHDKARDRNEARCKKQPAANEALDEYGRQVGEQIKDTGHPGLKTRRHFCNPLRHFIASTRGHRMNAVFIFIDLH
jgi:hypothetical protein